MSRRAVQRLASIATARRPSPAAAGRFAATDKIQDAPNREDSHSNRRVQNGHRSPQRRTSPLPAIVGDKNQMSPSTSDEKIPFMTSDFCDHRGMQVVFLGTSSSMPTLSRNTSCIALRLDGTIFMFDCGEGVQRQLHRTPFRQRTIDNIFITHMHGDHIFGLPGVPQRFLRGVFNNSEGLLCMIGMTAPSTRRPIEIYGPPGLRNWIRTTLKLSHARVPIKYVVHELVLHEGKRKRGSSMWNVADEHHEDELPGKDILSSQDDGLWHVHEDRKYVVVAGLLNHSIPCWGYVVEEKPLVGRFNVDKAKELGVMPGPLYAKLQQGNSVVLQDGRTVALHFSHSLCRGPACLCIELPIPVDLHLDYVRLLLEAIVSHAFCGHSPREVTKVNASDVLGPPRKGRKAVILGDTSDSRSLLVAARGADVLVHEATVIEQEADLAAHRGHSTASTAGQFARMIDAKSLVLTHFSGKLEGSLYGPSEKGTIADLVRAAKGTFGKQSVMAAYDLAAVTVVHQEEPLV